MTKSDQQKRVKAINALNFLRQHPALNHEVFGDSMFDGQWFHMAKCCKRGLSDNSRRMMTIYRDDKKTLDAIRLRDIEIWEKIQKRFNRDNGNSEDKRLQYVYATYQEIYGEPWAFDHVEYWYETTFFVYEGNPYDERECMDQKYWARYAGPEGGANTFEDALIGQAAKVKRIYGAFDKDRDFLTKAEKNNHKQQQMFLGDPFLKEKRKEITKDGLIPFRIEHNPEYLDVTSGMINLRWLAWFVETDYCKKNWDYHMKDFKKRLKDLDCKMPKARKILVEKYSSNR